jgi:carbonic anhydrase
MRSLIYFVFQGLLFSNLVYAASYPTPQHYIQTHESQAAITADGAIKKLQDGNRRFLENNMRNRDYVLQARKTATEGQAPFVVILSCMDSRGSPEILFDQGIGDIFSLRVAGNVINRDILASLEYATKVIGSKLIVVMGHTQCGAVEAACKGVQLGNITALLSQIKPAVTQVKGSQGSRASNCDPEMVDMIAKQNVINVVQAIPEESELISDLLQQKKVKIIGAMHNLKTGKVDFLTNERN